LLKKLFPGAPSIFNKKNITLWKDEELKKLLFYSLPRGFSEVVASILYRIDLWMVLLLLGPAESGVYAVMLVISNALRTVTNSFNPILLPVIAGMDKERLKTELKYTFSYCVGMTTTIQLIIGFFIVLFPKEILSIAGKSFVLQPEVLGILLFANISAGFFGTVILVLNGIGKSFYTLKVDIFSLCVAFLANYFLIPVFGLAGAAISTLAFVLSQVILNNIYLFKLNFFPYTKKLLIYVAWIIVLIILFIYSPYENFELWQKILLYLFVLPCLIASRYK
jgi:O-antigen/teichoic acid export membrane protein